MTDESNDTYTRLQETGVLQQRQQEVITALFYHPNGLTCWEIAGLTHRPINSVTPRMAELKRVTIQGVPLVIEGARVRLPGGRTNILWKINPLIRIWLEPDRR